MNIKTKLRWGILGAARINERLLPAIVEASNARLVAIASRRPGAASQTLAQYAPHQQNVQTYDNLEALLNDTDVEAVYLPLANHEHAEWTLRAIELGKHVPHQHLGYRPSGPIAHPWRQLRSAGNIILSYFMRMWSAPVNGLAVS